MSLIDSYSRVPYASAVPPSKEDIIRAAIMAEVRKRKLNPYQLWKLVAGKVGRTSIYNFMDGKAMLTTENASHVLKALGLSVHHSK